MTDEAERSRGHRRDRRTASLRAPTGAPRPKAPPPPSAVVAVGQLVWCPTDPLLGVGIVTACEDRRASVDFLHAGETRQYTTRSAEPAILRYTVQPGEEVRRRSGERVRVTRRLAEEGGLCQYELADGTHCTEALLVPFVRDVGAKERLASLNLSHPEAVRARVQGQRLGQIGGHEGVAAVLGARAEWLPHQIDVATQALEREPVRMLLADEVGLGKTVEAALIFAGLRAQGRAARVLVLVPEALCIQWLQEMYRKSHELVVLLDRARIDDALRDLPGTNPFEAHQRMVASIESVANDPVLARDAEAAPWDLVIVDEAHHLRWHKTQGGNLAYRLVEGLAAKAKHLLLLTATPMALDPAEYHILLRLLDKGRFDEPATFANVATRAHELRDVARALSVAVADAAPVAADAIALGQQLLLDDPSDTQRLQAFASLTPGDPSRSMALAPLLGGLQERHALSEFVTRNRRGPVGGLPQRHAKTFSLTPSPEQELLIDVGEEIMFELAQSIESPRERARVVGELLRALWATPRALLDVLRPYSEALCQQIEPHVLAVTQAPLGADGLPSKDARLRWLVQQVRALSPGEKLLVFVESNIAVRALRDALEPLLPGNVAQFHRDLSPRDQDRQVAYFRDRAGPQVMLSTEAGGEGRNFQFCHRVVLYDLPWRPATVEQRIGRVDRVGQKHDVQVLVPHFASGFEAAIVKIMQQSIGVLGHTVGGIDHALEYVSVQLAELILAGEGASGWKGLYEKTAKLVRDARARIDADVDPVLDHASFSPSRVQALLGAVPADLEARLQTFVGDFAEHNRVELASKGGPRVVVEGAVGAAGAASAEGFVGTFSRQDALDHEDVEFLGFGHPLVEQALEWAHHGHDASAALALARGFDEEGAVFLWTFTLGLPDEAAGAAAFFPDRLWTLAVDEAGRRRPDLESLLIPGARRLDRMDATPLRGSIERWRMLVEHNFEAAEALAQTEIGRAQARAVQAAQDRLQVRERSLRRAAMRQLLQAQPKKGRGKPKAAPKASEAAAPPPPSDALQAHHAEADALLSAIGQAQPRLSTVIAVRLLRRKEVSA